jgi:Zn finger protein HypA/HybF involved in hydrogenase expression
MKDPTNDDLQRMVTNNPLRRLVTRVCQNAECKHRWIQPSRTGRCPKCHSENVINEGERINALERL